MYPTLRKLAVLLALAAALPRAAPAQRPQESPVGVEKPWPSVGFVPVFDGRKSIPELGQTSNEDGDSILNITHAGDGSNRLFLVERLGRVFILQNGKLLPEPFLDIRKTTSIEGEHGLLSLAFPPSYKEKGHFYVFYTQLSNARGNRGDLVLARFKVDPKNPNHALSESEEVLMVIPHQPHTNHNGGQIAFGKDGMLYWGIGDGGLARDPFLAGQKLDAYLGKILRLDVEGPPDAGKAYRVPPDNPFLKTRGAKPEIWALGIRNPWHFSFDPANGDLYIGNVGQELWDQIYWVPGTSKGGDNFGWSIYEGTHAMNSNQTPGTPNFTFPVADFYHFGVTAFHSIIGGYVYRGKAIPAWQGTYFFSDWFNSQIWAMRRNDEGKWETHRVDNGKSPLVETVTFGVDEQGELYAAGFSDGKIYQLVDQTGKK